MMFNVLKWRLIEAVDNILFWIPGHRVHWGNCVVRTCVGPVCVQNEIGCSNILCIGTVRVLEANLDEEVYDERNGVR